jgi:hypothetical protein
MGFWFAWTPFCVILSSDVDIVQIDSNMHTSARKTANPRRSADADVMHTLPGEPCLFCIEIIF